MKYFSVFLPDPKTNHGQQTPDQREAMNAFVTDAVSRGEFISGGGFLPLAQHGAVVRRENGATRVIDGPYAEAKEWVGGFAMLEYASREAAVDGAQRFLAVAGDGECITYQVMDGPHSNG
ncbi:MAG: YciI family protein [Dokdonella sp.]|uniref:YciI family protein n=1 Tax=Dokdonella sp. TaxID=2291710 RepID=UPI0032673A01